MKLSISAILLLLSSAVVSPASLAQTSPGSAATDCSKSRDPARCDARQAAVAACADQRGPQKRKCIDGKMPPVDCSKAQNPARCEERQKAREACKDKVGKEHKQCLRAQSPKKAGKPAGAATSGAKN